MTSPTAGEAKTHIEIPVSHKNRPLFVHTQTQKEKVVPENQETGSKSWTHKPNRTILK